MYITYILYSALGVQYYIGFTGNDMNTRLKNTIHITKALRAKTLIGLQFIPKSFYKKFSHDTRKGNQIMEK
jgi:hypothetical protein